MLQKRRSFGTRKVSPPQPTCMTDDQKATYLKDLRSNRLTRPTGSRPLPARPSFSKLSAIADASPDSLELGNHDEYGIKVKRYSLPVSNSIGSMKGRPLVAAPTGPPAGRKVTPPEVRYRESAARQMEKKEAHSLRRALEEVDFQDDESRIHSAAQKEAADLVWKHRNPGLAEQEKTAPYRNPDLRKKRYMILEQGSMLDSRTTGQPHQMISRSPAETSKSSEEPRGPLKYVHEGSERVSVSNDLYSNRRRSSGNRKSSGGATKSVFRNPEDQIYEEPNESTDVMIEHHRQNMPLAVRTQNPSLRGARPLPTKPGSTEWNSEIKHNRIDIYKNPPSQSRDAAYRMNPSSRSATPDEVDNTSDWQVEIRSEDIRAATSMRRSDRSAKLPTPTVVSDRPGRPIVSFDPAWKPNDPTNQEQDAVNQALSRPLPIRPAPSVPQSAGTDLQQPSRSSAARPISSNATAPLPEIVLPDSEDVPSICVSEAPNELIAPVVPDIQVEDESHKQREQRRLTQQQHRSPTIQIPDDPVITPSTARLQYHQNSRSHKESAREMVAPPRQLPPGPHATIQNRLPWLSRPHITPTTIGNRGPTVTCAACDLPIAGRIVTASGAVSNHKARFHPECFNCFHCGTGLECVSFYPEPEAARLERLNSSKDNVDNSVKAQSFASNEADLRFYCHLDFHDLFSPRCGSCHTPIEGAVILAAGKSWHEGHFFCAECGDPFSSSSPFVESQGYAYCVGCHTKRTSARCRACKKQILDEISVEALGGKWHEECFRCDDCGEDFGEDGRFYVREVQIELTEKEKRRGMNVQKIEERAVCDGCEGRRLKSRDIAAFL